MISDNMIKPSSKSAMMLANANAHENSQHMQCDFVNRIMMESSR